MFLQFESYFRARTITTSTTITPTRTRTSTTTTSSTAKRTTSTLKELSEKNEFKKWPAKEQKRELE